LCAAIGLWFGLGVHASAERAADLLAQDPPTTPVEVLAAPRVLRAGGPVDLAELERETNRLGYRKVAHRPKEPGEFRRNGSTFEVYRRQHVGPLGPVSAAFVSLRAEGERLARLSDADGDPLRSLSLEPGRLGAYRSANQQERQPLELQAFPKLLVRAVLSAEDPRFLEHHGLDWRGILRATRDNLFGGEKLQGGSTITQQVLKNRVVGTERTIVRKLEEIMLAPLVERRVGKERILTIYLNEVYLGQQGSVSVVGFPAAAKYYFGKNISDLDLPESASLAGMLASPGRFDPRRHPEAGKQRRDWVLGQMFEAGFIDAKQRDAAIASRLETAPAPAALSDVGDLLDAVHRESVSRGWEPQPGVEPAAIHTTIDAELQLEARRALEATLKQLEKDDRRRAPLQAAVVVIAPATGEILAMVGARDGERGGFHRALDARRQPGSAFKPLVALAAIHSGHYAPSSPIEDAPLSVPTRQGVWQPENFDRTYRGRVTLRQTLEESLNVPMARVALELGPQAIVATAHAAGIESNLPVIDSLALGTGEVTPLELAVAYATLASHGQRRPASLIRTVKAAREGVEVQLDPVGYDEQALDPAETALVLDMLTGVITRGTGKALGQLLRGAYVAGKTGSTQDGRDAWFVYLSGSAVVVAWVGRDDAKPARLTGASAAMPIVRRLIEATGSRLLTPLPELPDEVVRIEVCAETGQRAGGKCPLAQEELFRAGFEPESCSTHLGFWRRLWRRE
jgi:penicillin-binding protein 1B